MYRVAPETPAIEPAARVVVDGLVAAYGAAVALRGVSFSLDAGRIYALVGPNGAGKTTLLRCLAGVHAPLAGSVTVDGVDLASAESLPRVGWMPDAGATLYPGLTARQHLVYESALARGAEVDVRGWLAAVGLRDDRTLVSGMSLGQKQRLGLALALLGDPALALLDEPTNGLDPEGRAALGRRLREAAARGTTVLVSSHALAELDAFCDACVVVEGGVVRSAGSLSEVAGAARGEAVVDVSFTHDVDVATLASCAPEARVVSCGGAAARIALADDPRSRSRALRAMLDAGLDVHEFTRGRARVAEVYARRGAAEGGGR